MHALIFWKTIRLNGTVIILLSQGEISFEMSVQHSIHNEPNYLIVIQAGFSNIFIGQSHLLRAGSSILLVFLYGIILKSILVNFIVFRHHLCDCTIENIHTKTQSFRECGVDTQIINWNIAVLYKSHFGIFVFIFQANNLKNRFV